MRSANCCHLIPSNRFLNGFLDPSQSAAAKLTHYSTMPHRPSDSSQPRQRLFLPGDVHQNPDPATKYPCSVCTSNVTSRGVSYMCNRCSGWVHSKCSGLQNFTPPIPQPLPSPITTKASDGEFFIILQFNVNGIGNKQVELGEFLERHKVNMAVIQESKLTLYSRTPNIKTVIEMVYSQINKLLPEARFTANHSLDRTELHAFIPLRDEGSVGWFQQSQPIRGGTVWQLQMPENRDQLLS